MKKNFSGGIFTCQNENFAKFGNEFLTIGFSKGNGQLSWVTDSHDRPVAGNFQKEFQSIKLFSNGKLNSYPPKFKHFYSLQPQDMDESGDGTRFLDWSWTQLPCGMEFTVKCGDNDWIFEQILEFEARRPFVKIDWKITCRKPHGARLRHFAFHLPEWTFHDPFVSLPGASSVPDSIPGQMPAETYYKFGAFSRNEADTQCAAVWEEDTDFMTLNRCINDGGKLFFSHEHYCAGYLEKDSAIRFGSDYIMVFNGTEDSAIEEYRRHYPAKALIDSAPRSSIARDAVIFEGNVGAILFDPDFSYCPYPTLADFKEDLPRIRSLGFNTIQLMPKMPFPWYTVIRYDDFCGTYGGESDDELKDFIHTTQKLGMRFLFDIVVHGVADAQSSQKGIERYKVRNRLFAAGLDNDEINDYRREHPEWFRYDDNGDIAFIHTWSLDFDSPSLCNVFTKHLKRCVSEFGCDGFRFDAPYWGCEPNWNRDYPLFAGASFTRNVKMLRDAKETLLKFKPDLLWYTEHEHNTWRAFMDMTYTYEESWLLWRPEPGKKLPVYEGSIDARKMARWFELRRLVLPRRDIVLQHHIDSHDSWWAETDSAFGRDRFGTAQARLLTAFCMFIDGAFLAYAGAEKGEEEFFHQMLSFRNSMPVLNCGDCDYTKFCTDHPRVLAFYRKYQEDECILLFNFNEETSRFTLCGADAKNERKFIDLLDEKEYTVREGLSLEMKPNSLMILSGKDL